MRPRCCWWSWTASRRRWTNMWISFFFQAEDGIRDYKVTGVQTCALPIYLVGFNLSPLLWKKVRRGLSAGRVQSPALRMICEREEEIGAFVAQEYWTIEGEGAHSAQSFPLKLLEYRGQKVEQFSFTNETAAREVERAIRAAAGAAGGGELRVLAIDRKQRRRNPAPPFTTSTLLAIDREHARSEEHTSELQSPCNLVCRLLLEKKKR